MTPEQHIEFLGSWPEPESFVDSLIRKYNLSPNSYYTESPYSKEFQETELAKDNYENGYKKSEELNEKWKDRIPKGWYGVSLGYPVPLHFYKVIDEFLERVEKECPDFEIYQIKIKFGGLRLYLGKVSEEISKEVHELEHLLFDEKLIY